MGALKKYSNDLVAYVTEKVVRAPKEVLVAKPRRGPIDYAALRKSTRIRFSKTLARLAE